MSRLRVEKESFALTGKAPIVDVSRGHDEHWFGLNRERAARRTVRLGHVSRRKRLPAVGGVERGGGEGGQQVAKVTGTSARAAAASRQSVARYIAQRTGAGEDRGHARAL